MDIETKEKLYVIGISVRTTNANGQSGKDLEVLWGKFWGEEVLKKIPDKASDDIYAVYTDYESDFRGAYTAIVGSQVTSLANIPPGFVGIEIDQARYERFVSRGRMPEAIFNTWLAIWANDDLNKRRAYKADFTVHGKKYFNGDQAEVETFISVRD
jgi:predicted transcriptional regulator YdeE